MNDPTQTMGMLGAWWGAALLARFGGLEAQGAVAILLGLAVCAHLFVSLRMLVAGLVLKDREQVQIGALAVAVSGLAAILVAP